MVQREVGERLAAGPGAEAYGAVSVKVAYWADGEGGGPGPAERVRAPAQGRVGPRRSSAGRPAGGRRGRAGRLFGLVEAGFGQRRKMLRRSLAELVGADAFAAAGRAARGPGRGAHPRALAPPGRRRRIRALTSAAMADLELAPAKLTLSLRIDRRPGRRLPPHRRRDGGARPGRRAALRARRRPGGRGRCGTGVPADDDNLVRRALAAVGRTAPRAPGQAHPGGRRPRRRVRRRRRRAAVGRLRATSPWPPAGGRRRRSAWSAAGPGCGASASRSSRCPHRRPGLHPAHPAGRLLAPRPSTGPGTTSAGPPPWSQRPRAGRARGGAGAGGVARPPGRGHRAGAGAGRQRLDLVRGGRLPRCRAVVVRTVAAERWATPRTDRPRAVGSRPVVLVGRPATCRRRGAASGCAFSIFLCFFLRMRLRRFLISDPMRSTTLPVVRPRERNPRAPTLGP